MQFKGSVFLIVAAAYVAAAIYLLIGMGRSQMFSHSAFELCWLLAFASIPLALYAVMRWWGSSWGLLFSCLLCGAMFIWCLLHAFVSGLPGNEFIVAEQLYAMLILPFGVGGFVAFQFSTQIVHYASFIGIWLLIFGLSVNFTSRAALAQQFENTLARGGCVLVGEDVRKQVFNVDDVRLGFFIGTSSDRVVFVEGNQFFSWSYPEWGLEMRRDAPLGYSLRDGMKCS